MPKLIPLSAHGRGGAWAIVDDDDFAALRSVNWALSGQAHRWRYAKRLRDGSAVYMHRELAGLAPDDPRKVDHVNGNTLDNRRSNLRIATTALNAQNQGSRGGSSRHRGVSWCNTRRKWTAQAQLDGRKINLGRYETEQEAADAAAAFRAEHMPYSTDAEEVAMSRLLIANVTSDKQTEAEAVLVETDDPKVIVLELEDGKRLEFDRTEMATALVDLAA